MAQSHALFALKRKYGLTLGQLRAAPVDRVRIMGDLAALARVIRLFEPECDVAAIAPIRVWSNRRGRNAPQWTRLALELLRQANRPLTGREIARRITAQLGIKEHVIGERAGVPVRRPLNMMRVPGHHDVREQGQGARYRFELLGRPAALGRNGPVVNRSLQIQAAFAEMERNLIRQRVNEGLTAARARGRQGGRPRVMTPERLRFAQHLMADKTRTIPQICRELGDIPSSTLYHYVHADGTLKDPGQRLLVQRHERRGSAPGAPAARDRLRTRPGTVRASTSDSWRAV